MGEEDRETVLGNYRAAGTILAEVKAAAVARVKEGVSLLEVAEFVEEMTREKGGEPAFPCNISRNEEAAHATPAIGDGRVFGPDLVKLDIGVHVDGYIADSAVTVDLSGEHGDLVEAAEAALAAAIRIIHDGVSAGEIGEVIENAIREHGYRPVVNLSGHGLARYDAHVRPTIPNTRSEHGPVLKENDVVAIEPFATDGVGKVTEGGLLEIYGLIRARPVRVREAKQLLKTLEQYHGLPFAKRWLPRERLDLALRTLSTAGALREYPVLREEGSGMVSQAEHTVIVTKNGCEVTTK
ncbi:MAG TPA: type II methionyl aminopeptidase [Methanomicrobia archaeon]|nr:type II methionyl aminopeptidase [Methanomicrobia archaeon]